MTRRRPFATGSRRVRPRLESLEKRFLLASSVVINEFMAINESTLQDEDGDFSDWIELHNVSSAVVNLGGWFLTDDPEDLTRWRFPTMEIQAGGHLTVFASDKDRDATAGRPHTNFRLSGDGEYLALVEPDGTTIATEFAPFPSQIADVSYGLGAQTTTTELVAADDPVRTHVPSDGDLQLDWTGRAFDDEQWQPGNGGVGYDQDGNYDPLIGADVESSMYSVNPGIYSRTEFDLSDADAVDRLSLQVQYDDGFIAYLNGQEVASRNARSFGLMSYWDFDGTLQDRASDYESNSGTIEDDLSPRGGTARYAAGKVGQALAIGVQAGDATDLSAALGDDVRLPSTYTIETWIRPTELSDSWQRLVLNWGGADFSYHFAIRNNSGFNNGVSLFHGESDGGQPNANGGTVALNQWQHIVGVADGTTLRVYLNGNEVAAVPYDGTIHRANSEGLGIGDSFSSISSIKFNGWIDELAIWNVPLSAQRIRSHYQADSAGYGLLPSDGQQGVQWNSTAASDRNDADATTVETIDLTNFTEFVEPGRNVLAVHGLNSSADDRDFLLRTRLLSGQVTVSPDVQGYFTEPTPGGPNGVGITRPGPIIRDVQHRFLPPEGVTATTLLDETDPLQVIVPADGALGLAWTDPDYVPGSQGETWTDGSGGVGFDLDGDYDDLIETDIEDAMHGVNSSALIRSEFQIDDLADIERLRLDVRYDDGFVAFLNGEPVAGANATTSSSSASPETGLVTYYAFDGDIDDNADLYANGSGTNDDDLSASAAAGNLSVAYEPGVVGQAVRISRNSGDATILQAVDSNDLDLASSWTVEAFVRPDSANSGEWDRFATKWFDGSNQWHWAFRYANNGQDLFMNGGQVISGNSTPTVPLNQWTHVAWTGDPTQGIRLWQNGVVVATAPYQAVGPGTDNFRLGNYVLGDASLQFSGLVDELAIWSVALTPEQLAQHASAGAAGYGLTPLEIDPGDLAWNAAASQSRDDAEAVVAQTFDLTGHRGLLRQGTNVLAVQALNADAHDRDLLFAASLTGERGSDTQGRIEVTALVTPALDDISTVNLNYRVMFDDEHSIAMADDGTGGDQIAEDGTYTALLPSDIADPGEMLRYYVRAGDVSANLSRAPLPPPDSGNAPEYFGTVIEDPSINSALPVLHRFIEDEAAAETGSGTRGSIYYAGEFYDNVFIRIRGGTARSWPKKSYKIEFNDGYHFRFDPDLPRVDEFNLNATYTDKSYVRPVLAYELHRDAGSAAPITFHMRVHQNGRFFSVADFIEQPDRDFLRRVGLDDDGALYKGNHSPTNGLTGSATGGAFEKKNRRSEDFSDLQALIDGLAQSGTALEDYVFDNIDLPAQVNFMAVNVILQNIDATDKNFYIYRDTEGSGEWRMLPWDLDLVLGPDALNTDVIVAADEVPPKYTSHPYLGSLAYPYTGRKNHLFDAVINIPRTNEMFLRRVRTLMDDLLNSADTPEQQRYFETRIDELVALLGPDVLEDKARWGGNAHFGSVDYTLQAANDRIKNEYLDPRRTHLFETHTSTSDPSEIVTLLAADAPVRALVPTGPELGTGWTAIGFDDSQWIAGNGGVGYDEATTYSGLIGLDLRSNALPAGMRIDTDGDGTSENDSVYVRSTFQVADPDQLTELRLRMKYDDGFVAYINGTKVAEVNAPATPAWNSNATGLHDDAQALVYQSFDISAFGGPAGVLVPGANVLAIHLLNDATNGAGTSSDLLAVAELIDGVPQVGGGVGIPARQTGIPAIEFGTFEQDPVSGNQDEEFIQLTNSNDTPVDISGWRLTGGVEHEFAPGTIIPSDSSLYVSPNVAAFRARQSGPSGGQGLFAQGDYSGHLSNLGEQVALVAADGTPVDSFTTEFAPSDVQRFLRVTEIMYHPSAPSQQEIAAGFTDQDDFEFLELRNVSDTVTLDLNGVRVTQGFSTEFDFTGSSVTSLAPGEHVLLARDSAALALRYGNLPVDRIAGQFDGGLNNDGESLKIEDADNNTVQEFTYNDNEVEGWPERADGQGASLNVLDTAGDYDDPHNWFAGSGDGGSPAAEPEPSIVGRHVFYDNSYFDDQGSGRSDHDAVAPGIRALRPGQTATTANYTSYLHGLNGVMIDVVSLPPGGLPTPNTFEFRVGRDDDDVSAWADAPVPASVAIERGRGVAGTDRIVLTWENDAIVDTWLRIEVASNTWIGLGREDVFYFGNAPGESGNSTANTFVDGVDFAGARDNPRGAMSRAAVDDPYDFNRDSFVDGTDLAIVRDYHTNFLTALPLITPGADMPPGPGLVAPDMLAAILLNRGDPAEVGRPVTARKPRLDDDRGIESAPLLPPRIVADRTGDGSLLSDDDPADESDNQRTTLEQVLAESIDWLDELI